VLVFKKYRRIVLPAVLLLATVGALIGWRIIARNGLRDSRAPLTGWPWPRVATETPHPGVTLHTDRSSSNGDTLYLFDFDFAANPNLRLELYDQDEDDAKPSDNQVHFWPRGVGQTARHLNEQGRGRVVAAWNGSFFNSNGMSGDDAVANHVASVVLDGKVRANVASIRWTAGVQYSNGKPIFKALHQPDGKTQAAEFTFAAAAAQCLLCDGKPLKLEPAKKSVRRPYPSTPKEAGYIPGVNEIKTSRTSMAWSRDNKHFYLLIVKEPDDEANSLVARYTRHPGDGGWTLADLQRFWQNFGAWGAVNLDGGDVTQMTALRSDGRYLLVPPAWASKKLEMSFSPRFYRAPPGGSIMFFYVRDTSAK